MEYFRAKARKSRISNNRKLPTIQNMAFQTGAEPDLPLQQQERTKEAKKGDDVKLFFFRIRYLLDAKSQL